jgi:MYXO-CTERM domain-containing protein
MTLAQSDGAAGDVAVGAKRWAGAGVFAPALVCCAVSCGGAPPGEDVGTTSSAIQGGSVDGTHQFAVGIVQLADEAQNMIAICSGVLLAPNLVATARHCVAALDSTTIDCASSTFGPLFPATEVFVTDQTTLTMQGLVPVSNVIVPTASNEDAVCGNDIALLILGRNISLPEYVEPVISPPMTNPIYDTVVTAIGYGIDTPTDMNGTSAGTRRIKENVQIACIPGDTTIADCFSDPTASQVLTSGEFVSGDSTCEGDSGSGAFEQSAFNQGQWVAFGVLSRGGVSTDGQTCEQPIYTRFDAWGPLIIDAAQQAAQKAAALGASYTLPAWAGTAVDGGATVAVDAGVTVTTSMAGMTGGSGGCALASPGGPGPVRRDWGLVLGVGGAIAAVRRRRRRAASGPARP